MRCGILVCVLVVGCGGSSKPAPEPPHNAPPPAAAAPVATRPADTAGDPPPPPPESDDRAPKHLPLWDRLRDGAGPVAGLPGYELIRHDDPGRCSGVVVVTRAGKVKLSPDDKPFADVLALEFPVGLNFTRDKDASMKKFQDWMQTLIKVGGDAVHHYEGQIEHAKDPAVKVAAAARIAQIHFRLASVLSRAEIPSDVAGGEYAADKIDAFCDTLASQAEPLQMKAEQAAAACADKAKQLGVRTGWWTTVCAP